VCEYPRPFRFVKAERLRISRQIVFTIMSLRDRSWPMRLEWDDAKNRVNFKKHKISFETASLVFDDPHALSLQDRIVEAKSDGILSA